MRLKQATAAISGFQNVRLVSAADEVITAFELGGPFDVVFIGERFSEGEVRKLIGRCRALPGGKDARFILVRSGQVSNGDSAMARALLGGVDACLFEPYSVENITETVEIALARAESSESRMNEALMLTLDEARSEIDRAALMLKSGCRHASAPFETLRRTISELCMDAEQLYFTALVEHFECAPLPQALGKSYFGASRRVRRMTEQKQQEAIKRAILKGR